jgi:hypothetical protein
MKTLKNIAVGLLVSYIGSIPLGYLNIIGYQIYTSSGNEPLILYLLGVICIEAIVIYFTLLFAKKLTNNVILLKSIEIFSIVFMLVLAFVFYSQSEMGQSTGKDLSDYNYPPFVLGLLFSSLNFVQIPFWVGWNLYLLNARYISAEKRLRLVYIFGTLAGTFLGMLTFVKFLNIVAMKSGQFSTHLMSHVIPLFFVGMAFFQAFQFYRKHYRRRSQNR